MAFRAGVVYVRGTPGCGKSTMAKLLQHNVLKSHGNIKVYYISWTPKDFAPWYEYMSRQIGLPFQSDDAWLAMRNTLLIIDEVQVSLNDTGLWSDLIKPMSERWRTLGPRIVLFGSCGSPLVGPSRGSSRSKSFPPAQFPAFAFSATINHTSKNRSFFQP